MKTIILVGLVISDAYFINVLLSYGLGLVDYVNAVSFIFIFNFLIISCVEYKGGNKE